MAIEKNYSRQGVIAAEVVIALDDFTGAAEQAAIQLPAGAVIVGGSAFVTTAFDAGTTATLTVGDADDKDRYTSAALDVSAEGAEALGPTGYAMPVEGDLLVTYASTGSAATEGELRLVIQYIVLGRTEFTQG